VNGSILLSVLVIMLAISAAARDELAGDADAVVRQLEAALRACIDALT
jgi:hypothetical protein